MGEQERHVWTDEELREKAELLHGHQRKSSSRIGWRCAACGYAGPLIGLYVPQPAPLTIQGLNCCGRIVCRVRVAGQIIGCVLRDVFTRAR